MAEFRDLTVTFHNNKSVEFKSGNFVYQGTVLIIKTETDSITHLRVFDLKKVRTIDYSPI